MFFLSIAGISATNVPPIGKNGRRSSRTFSTICTSSSTIKFMIGIPAPTSSPLFGKIVDIWPDSGAVKRASCKRAATSSTVPLAAFTKERALSLSCIWAPSSAIWYWFQAARSPATAASYKAFTSSRRCEETTLSLYRTSIRL